MQARRPQSQVAGPGQQQQPDSECRARRLPSCSDEARAVRPESRDSMPARLTSIIRLHGLPVVTVIMIIFHPKCSQGPARYADANFAPGPFTFKFPIPVHYLNIYIYRYIRFAGGGNIVFCCSDVKGCNSDRRGIVSEIYIPSNSTSCSPNVQDSRKPFPVFILRCNLL